MLVAAVRYCVLVPARGFSRQNLQHILAAAIGAGNFAFGLIDMQKYARVAQRAVPTVALHFQGIHFNDFKRLHDYVLIDRAGFGNMNQSLNIKFGPALRAVVV